MERKTMGAFIAVLRKSSGMTQRDLAEQLGVSDKTISHWERDESAPDISIIPIIADIFGVTCDELLRGEKLPQNENSNTEFSQKSEKQINYLLTKQALNYRLQCIITAGVCTIGLVVSYLLYDAKAVSALLVNAIFAIIAAITLMVFTILNKSKLTSFELDEKYLTPHKTKARKNFTIVLSFIIFTVIASVLFETGISPIANLIILLIGLCILSFTGVLGGKRLKSLLKLTAVTAICVCILTAGFFGILSAVNNHYHAGPQREEITFNSIYEFKDFLETEKPYPVYAEENDKSKEGQLSAVFGSVKHEELIIQNGVTTYTIYKESGEKLLAVSIAWKNLEVASFDATVNTSDGSVEAVVNYYENKSVTESLNAIPYIYIAVVATAAVVIYIINLLKIFGIKPKKKTT